MERSLIEALRALDTRLESVQPVFQLLSDGLDAYRDRLLKEDQFSRIRNHVFETVRADTELRFPHRKILDFLLGEYDYTKAEFKEVQFSRLVREARIGKNMANSYLSVLERKALVVRRSDGYRVFFRIRA